MWSLFNFFVLSAFDFDIQEQPFAAGHGCGYLISNEEVAMKDTFAQFQKVSASR